MDYFRLINLAREPFSNSPDPRFFFQTRSHLACLQKLEMALRLRRGLNVVVGAVGTGKTTLCRQLIRRFAGDADVATHLILDPGVESPRQLLVQLAEMFACRKPEEGGGLWDLKEAIKGALLAEAVAAGRTVVLIIDEGQKLPSFGLELLRELLNYETNEAKLLQIVIFAQGEFEAVLARHANFADRINLLHRLGPLDFADTRRLIRYRLACASEAGAAPSLFSPSALWRIHRAAGGYPRQIIHLCHRSLLLMIIQGRGKVGWRQVGAVQRQGGGAIQMRRSPRRAIRLALVGILLVTAGGWAVPHLFDLAPVDGAFRDRSEPLSVPVPHKTPAVAAAAPPVGAAPPGTAPIDVGLTPGDRPSGPAPAQGKDAVAHVPGEVAAKTAETGAAGINAGSGLGAAAILPADSGPPRTEAAAVALSPPEVLGVATLRRGEWLSWVCVKVYGAYDLRLRRRITEANPGIRDADDIAAGEPIRLPARALPVHLPDGPMHWVRIARAARLEQALDLLRGYPPQAPPLRLIPTWHPIHGLQFDAVLWRTSADLMRAAALRAALPPDVRAEASVWDGWPDGTVFFADPLPETGA